jgi:2,4-dienoyl-CoA reductase-like NADH-dependent reductase (Old Yellow Enzyme family)/thioredoxin reductase
VRWDAVDDELRGRLPILLAPGRIGRLELRNRLVMAPHTTAFTSDSTDNLPTDRHVVYYRERARGGIGLVITEGLHVHRTSFQAREIDISRDDALPKLAEIAEAVHGEGATLIGQTMHTGGHGGNIRTGWLAPSPLPWASTAPVPHQLSPREIRDIARSFGSAAARLVQAGFDAIEVHLGHGHLLHQILSPLTNHRDDEFGGSAAARLRAPREALEHVAAALEPGRVLGIRVSGDDLVPGGLALEDMLELVGELLAALPIDYVHVSHSMYLEGETLATQIADMTFSAGAFRHLPAAFKRRFPETTVIGVCRLDDPETAVSMISSGHADLIAMARALIADPSLPLKLARGEPETIRSCIHCNQGCVGRLEIGAAITCFVNPEVGFEEVFHRAVRPSARRTVVVGGGPGGLQAAVEARSRGHEVLLVEAQEALGGQLRVAAMLSGREELLVAVDELARDARRLGVVIELGRRAQEADLLETDAVVVATGAKPVRAELAGTVRVWTVLEAIAASGELGDDVAIWDRDGSWAGAGLALDLARRGKRISLVCAAPSVAWSVTVYSRLSLIPRLAELGVRIYNLERPERVEDGRLVIRHVLNGDERTIPAASVVATGGLVADDALYRGLEASGYEGELHLIGDAFAPRSALEAIFDGKIAGAAIGLAPEDAAALPGRSGDSLAARTFASVTTSS